MFKIILKHSLILSLPLWAFGAYAMSGTHKEKLANECSVLSDSVSSLLSSQQQSVCIDKLHLASMQIDTAGTLILVDVNTVAKKQLEDAITTLQFAELNSCNRYIQISHAKFEVQRIKNSI